MVLSSFQYRVILLIWIIVEQGHAVLIVGVGGSCLDIFSNVTVFLSPSLYID